MTASNNELNKGMAIDKLGASFAPASKEQKTASGVGNGLVVTKVNGQMVNSAEDVQKALGNTNRNMISVSGVTSTGTFNYSFPAQ